MLFILLNSITDVKSITQEISTLSMLTIEQSCIYCQTTACYCPLRQYILNCSSYLLNIPFIENCTKMIIWKTVDFSLRNLKILNAKKLLSLRMERLLLKSNFITYIHNNTFDSIGNILIELDLEKNQIFNLSSKWLNSKLIYLKKLNLAFNQFELFDNIDNIQLSNLQELNLSHNYINIFPNKIYQWISLIKLDLSFNKLLTIPRFALMGLNNLTWLSLASNKNLTCIIQDSFKYLKSLNYLDLSNTNLLDLDACIFIQLTGLKILSIEHILFNCTSCWFSIARKNSLQIFGQCLNEKIIQNINSLTDKQIQYACLKSSIDCSLDYCEPGSINYQQKSNQLISLVKNSHITKKRTIEIIFSIIILIIMIITLIIFISRWKQNKKLFCCLFSQTTTTTTTTEETRRRRQQIIDNNPTVIESVVTHGANMNVPSYSCQNYSKFNDETSNNKRKLYNPMFADSPTLDIRHQQQQQQQQSVMASNDNTSHNSQLYSEKL
ncbi:unnamed protein product [Rotaria sordida]|uniref:Uncharacterized protein n=1 Tax=Rotaria sordida TaxID=392033 RepID=A0A819CZY0_9BILA|nr:unnamed protein product [Rotaria sordida]